MSGAALKEVIADAKSVKINDGRIACYNCRWHWTPPGKAYLVCRRYPPSTVERKGRGQTVVEPVFPLTEPEFQCGEFRT